MPVIGSLVFLRNSGYRWHVDRWLDAAFVTQIDALLLQALLIVITAFCTLSRTHGKYTTILLLSTASLTSLFSTIFFILSLNPNERPTAIHLHDSYVAVATNFSATASMMGFLLTLFIYHVESLESEEYKVKAHKLRRNPDPQIAYNPWWIEGRQTGDALITSKSTLLQRSS
uniref:MARVEL domain-containing protein n=1 Tax=Syphacia muris TaxID=451379 RepID=A0A0N5ATJ0_9BILA